MKTLISLGIRPVWSESSLCAQWVAKGPRFLHADSEDSDQTGQMPRLIWVFTGCTLTLLVLSCRGSFHLTDIKTISLTLIWVNQQCGAKVEDCQRKPPVHPQAGHGFLTCSPSEVQTHDIPVLRKFQSLLIHHVQVPCKYTIVKQSRITRIPFCISYSENNNEIQRRIHFP